MLGCRGGGFRAEGLGGLKKCRRKGRSSVERLSGFGLCDIEVSGLWEHPRRMGLHIFFMRL